MMSVGERGQVLPFVAICLAVLMGFAGLAIDLGYLQYQQRQQQSATDAAAIGGAQALITKGCPDQTAAQTAAFNDSASNGFTNATGGVTVTVINPPNSGPFSGVNCAVQVNLTSPHATWFSKLYGFSGLMTTTAIATITASGTGCMYILDPNGTPTFNGNLKLTAPGCTMLINGSPTFNGGCGKATINYIGIAGTNPGNCSVAESMLPVADPCPLIAGCNSLTKNPPSTSPCGAFSGGAITPGCYNVTSSGINPSSMSPGLYVFTGTGAINLGGLTATGITIYAAGSTYLTLGGSGATLSACTTSCTNGAVANVLYYQVSSDTAATDTHGSSNDLSGLIYAPSSDMTISGNSGSGYTVFIVDDITINGGGTGMTFNSPPPNGSIIPTAVLAY